MRSRGTERPLARRPRVLFIAPELPPYRAPEADHALQECLHLVQAGADVHVLTRSRPDVARPVGLDVHTVESWSWREFWNVARLIATVQPDAAILFFLGHLYGYATLPLFIPLMVKVLRPRASFVSQFSNLGSGAPSGDRWALRVRRGVFQALGRFRYGMVLPLSRRILLMSERHVSILAERHPGLLDKTVLCPPPPRSTCAPDDPGLRQAARERFAIPDDAFVFGYFSRLYPRKGVEQLLRAFSRMRDDVPDIHLLFIGGYHSEDAWFQLTSYPEHLAGLCDELRLSSQVHWTGEYDWHGNDAAKYLNALDVAVLPFDSGIHLHNSSFAAVSAHHLPVIATYARGRPDPHIVADEHALLIPPQDVAALESAMRSLHADSERRARLEKGAEELEQRWFTWDACMQTITEALAIRG